MGGARSTLALAGTLTGQGVEPTAPRLFCFLILYVQPQCQSSFLSLFRNPPLRTCLGWESRCCRRRRSDKTRMWRAALTVATTSSRRVFCLSWNCKLKAQKGCASADEQRSVRGQRAVVSDVATTVHTDDEARSACDALF